MAMTSQEFAEKADLAFEALFEAARSKRELQFAMALIPELRGMQDPGWSTAVASAEMFDEYLDFLDKLEEPRIKVHVALGFYSHISEASGFYEVPKNMLRIIDGKDPVLRPFEELVQRHKATGDRIAPNSNKVLKDLMGHAEESGLCLLSEVFRDAFDPDIRNGYAHADYVVWDDGIRLPKRSGGQARKVEWAEFAEIFQRGVSFFHVLRAVSARFIQTYNPSKVIRGRLGNGPEENWRISWDAGTFIIESC